MTAHEAYQIIKKNLAPGDDILHECCDFGEFYGFGFTNNERDYYFALLTVDKSNGHTSALSPIEILALIDTMKKIPIDEVLQGESKYVWGERERGAV